MSPLRLLVLFGAVGLFLGAAGCSGQLTVGMFTSDAGGSGSATSASGASNGSAGSTVASGTSTGTSAPACQITSAQSTLVWDVACYPQSALPSGACSEGSASCSFCSFAECADVPDQTHSPRTFYSCVCDGGQWSCAIVNQDVGICPLSANDASDDAGEDAGVSCDDGTGATNCCPANAAEGVACDSTVFTSVCLTRCGFASPDASMGYREDMQCSQGMWNAGLGLLPCERLEAGSGASGSVSASGSISPVSPVVACDDYFAAQYDRGCGGPQLPPTEAARLRTRFEQVCQNQYALPGSGITPAALEACASALEASPCELPDGPPAACAFQGSLPGGAACNEGFQCQSQVCQGTADFSPGGQIGPNTCGTCSPPVADAGTPVTYGDIGATCDDPTTLSCKTGLYCAAQTAQCVQLAVAGAPCGEGPKPPGNPGGCVPPLSCVGNAGAATCSLGATGAFCLDDLDCAPGLGCVPGPCAPPGVGARIGCAASGTCGAVAWASAGQPCNPPETLCLVGSCSDEVSLGPPPISPEGGLYPGTCGRVIADGQSADDGNVFATCDTFAEPFQANYQFMNGVPSPAGTCTLLDSITCK
jgi:hypothetical protein